MTICPPSISVPSYVSTIIPTGIPAARPFAPRAPILHPFIPPTSVAPSAKPMYNILGLQIHNNITQSTMVDRTFAQQFRQYRQQPPSSIRTSNLLVCPRITSASHIYRYVNEAD